nr:MULTISPECIES: hypothetical protein [Acinetobacter]
MIIKSYEDLDPYFKDFQWTEHRKDQASLFIAGAEFQAHFLYFAGHTPEKRQALAECIEEYNRHYAEYFTWGLNFDEQGKVHYTDMAEMPTIREVIAKIHILMTKLNGDVHQVIVMKPQNICFQPLPIEVGRDIFLIAQLLLFVCQINSYLIRDTNRF